VNCPDNGLVIGADGITLNLNGHTVDGDAVSDPSCPPGRGCDVGVDNLAGHSHVTIEGGTIRQFKEGVHIEGAGGDHLHRLAISHIDGAAIVARNTTGTVVDENTMSDPGVVAVVLQGSSDARVSANTASGSVGYAMFLMTDHSTIQRNRLTADVHGLAVAGTDDLVLDNTSDNGSSIDVFDGSSNVRVEGNHLRNVGDGVTVGVASEILVQHNVVDATGAGRAGGFGVILDGSIRSTVNENQIRVSGSGPGIYVAHLDAPTPPHGNRVTHNFTTSRNADGILVDPDATGTLLFGNVAVNSGDDGIDVNAPGTKLANNITNHNRDLGIEAVPGVIDGGGNHAAGNGNPAQCTNIACR
jgi:hypothetical protein